MGNCNLQRRETRCSVHGNAMVFGMPQETGLNEHTREGIGSNHGSGCSLAQRSPSPCLACENSRGQLQSAAARDLMLGAWEHKGFSTPQERGLIEHTRDGIGSKHGSGCSLAQSSPSPCLSCENSRGKLQSAAARDPMLGAWERNVFWHSRRSGVQ